MPQSNRDSSIEQVNFFIRQSALLLSDGQHAQALQTARDGLALGIGNADLNNLAGICASLTGDAALAEKLWRQAIALDPLKADAHNNLGTLLEKQRRYDQAKQCFRQVVALEPSYAGAYSNLGVVLAATAQDIEAETCYRQAIALDPRNADTYSNLGILLAKHRQFIEAEHCYRQALAIHPDHAIVHTNLGLLLQDCGRFAESEQCHRHALRLAPASSAIHANLANLLASLRREPEAEALYRRAITLDPTAAIAYSNLGVLLSDLHREQEAEQCFRQAIARDPGYEQAHYNFGVLLLSQGRFTEGWPHHEFRYASGYANLTSSAFHPSCPQWQGEALQGKSLLVRAEQGLGDQIQFCRYLPLLKAQGAAHITLVCPPSLTALMTTVEGIDAILTTDETAIGQHDYWTFLLSIPIHLKTGIDTIPAHLPYVRSAPERKAKWAARLPRDAFLIGLVWRGNANHSNDANRSLTSIGLLAPLWSVPGVRFVSLQKGNGEDEATNPPASMPLLHLGSDLGDLADTAAIVDQLDLVISVDTAVAHLAGALGKACWVMLPAHKVDWRWSKQSDRSSWYPCCMRLFRQQEDEDWAPVVNDVADALRAVMLDKTAVVGKHAG